MSRNDQSHGFLTSFTYISAMCLVALDSANSQTANCELWPKETFFETATITEIEHCVETGSSLSIRDDNGRTPLHNAVVSSVDSRIVSRLLTLGADVNAVTSEDETALYLELEKMNSDPHVITALLEHDADPNAVVVSFDNDTPFLMALRRARSGEIVEKLLENGGRLWRRGRYNSTVFHNAAVNENLEVIQTILRAIEEADNWESFASTVDEDGEGPLHWASRWNANPKAIEFLAKNTRPLAGKGNGVQARAYDGRFPIHMAAAHNPEAIAALIAEGSSPNVRDNVGRSPLHIAVLGFRHDRSAVQSLLKHGALVNVVDEDGNTPLHLLVDKPSQREQRPQCDEAEESLTPVVSDLIDSMDDLLDGGIMPNARNDELETPLHILARTISHSGLLRHFVKKGANPNARNEDGETPLHVAVQAEQHPEFLQCLIKQGAYPNARDENGDSPLHVAVKQRVNPDIVQALLRAGARPAARNEQQETPLHWSVRGSDDQKVDLAVVKQLLNAITDQNVHDAHSTSVDDQYQHTTSKDFDLHSAQEYGVNHIAEFVNVRDDRRETPLHWAVRWTIDLQIISLLLNHGADPNIENTRRKTPISYVDPSANPDAYNLLAASNPTH